MRLPKLFSYLRNNRKTFVFIGIFIGIFLIDVHSSFANNPQVSDEPNKVIEALN